MRDLNKRYGSELVLESAGLARCARWRDSTQHAGNLLEPESLGGRMERDWEGVGDGEIDL